MILLTISVNISSLTITVGVVVFADTATITGALSLSGNSVSVEFRKQTIISNVNFGGSNSYIYVSNAAVVNVSTSFTQNGTNNAYSFIAGINTLL